MRHYRRTEDAVSGCQVDVERCVLDKIDMVSVILLGGIYRFEGEVDSHGYQVGHEEPVEVGIREIWNCRDSDGIGNPAPDCERELTLSEEHRSRVGIALHR